MYIIVYTDDFYKLNCFSHLSSHAISDKNIGNKFDHFVMVNFQVGSYEDLKKLR